MRACRTRAVAPREHAEGQLRLQRRRGGVAYGQPGRPSRAVGAQTATASSAEPSRQSADVDREATSRQTRKRKSVAHPGEQRHAARTRGMQPEPVGRVTATGRARHAGSGRQQQQRRGTAARDLFSLLGTTAVTAWHTFQGLNLGRGRCLSITRPQVLPHAPNCCRT